MEEYNRIKIQHICSNICSGGTPKSTVTGYYGGDIPWLNTKEINFNRIYKTEKTITNEGLNNSSAKWIPAKSVIVAMYGATAGKIAINQIPLTTNQACCNLIIDSTKADYRFVYYALCQDYNYLSSLANGGAQQNLNAQLIKEFEIPFPSLDEQKLIANILSSLDDKIELNRRINENLEQQAQALFKAWFVDFEPFKDGKFVDSELGKIPEGWTVKKLGELCDSISVTHPCKEGQLIFLNTGDIENGFILNHKYMNIKDMPGQAKKSIQENDILYSEIRPINRHFAFVNFAAQEYIVSTKLMVLRANDNKSSMRLYQYLTSDNVINELQHEAESRSGTFPQIRFENIKNLKILIGSDDVEKQYTKYIENIYKIIFQYRKEITKLTQLRDTILPHLMSGELEIKDR